MGACIRLECRVGEAPHFNPVWEVLQSVIRIENRGPRHRKGVHAILVLQHMSRIAAVLAAASRNDTVITPIAAPMSVQELQQFLLSPVPVDLLLSLGEPAGVTNALFIDV